MRKVQVRVHGSIVPTARAVKRALKRRRAMVRLNYYRNCARSLRSSNLPGGTNDGSEKPDQGSGQDLPTLWSSGIRALCDDRQDRL
jgi:hypothetical protein